MSILRCSSNSSFSILQISTASSIVILHTYWCVGHTCHHFPFLYPPQPPLSVVASERAAPPPSPPGRHARATVVFLVMASLNAAGLLSPTTRAAMLRPPLLFLASEETQHIPIYGKRGRGATSNEKIVRLENL